MHKWLGQGYVETMGNRLVSGRTFTWSDVHDHAPVALVNETFAREYWKEPAAALGKRIREAPNSPWRTIVGVVGDERDDGLARPAPATSTGRCCQEDFWGDRVSVQRIDRLCPCAPVAPVHRRCSKRSSGRSGR